jgi:hypothetical protein
LNRHSLPGREDSRTSREGILSHREGMTLLWSCMGGDPSFDLRSAARYEHPRGLRMQANGAGGGREVRPREAEHRNHTCQLLRNREAPIK